jgi:Asp-tRNA(Asn)/Glu-tRNA(Gln) amidotransferase A subunit family amidase
MRTMKKNVLILLLLALSVLSCKEHEKKEDKITVRDIAVAERLVGLKFSNAERDSMIRSVNRNLESFHAIHEFSLENRIAPALVFNPIPTGFQPDLENRPVEWPLPEEVSLPENRDELAFYSVAALSVLIRTKKISSFELTRFFLDRLKKYSDTLECLVTLTSDVALEQARQADLELSKGVYRGPLHGIPYGIKDLFAYPGYPTSWGAMPFKEQVIDEKAAVIYKLEEAGAILLGKLTLGALAMGDVWYGGKTRNPWNLEEGSSGSSAGSAAATAAGLVPFAIGTETWGSIVSPSTRCGVTGLRPTFGSVSRAGGMALSWSMDKAGPICRSALDCGLVFQAITGVDPADPATLDIPFNYALIKHLGTQKIAYLDFLFDDEQGNRENDSLTLEIFKELGVELHTITLPNDLPVDALSFILNVEAAAAFDELTRSNQDDLLVRQGRRAWPNNFRKARMIPAVEYIQANRIRSILISQVNELFQDYDVIIAPTYGGDQGLMTNLTGHPCLVMPNGFNEKGGPASICLLGNLFSEGKLIEVARHYQLATGFEDQHPPLFQ